MAFPIRFKLTRKDTGETFKQWAIRTGVSDLNTSWGCSKYRLRPAIDLNGTGVYLDHEDNWYLSYGEFSPADWKLEVATSKLDGKWQYEQVGY